jgi:hypothetical protein
MRGILTFAVAFALAPLPAAAEPVPVRLVWDGNDAVGGILINRVRGLIAASADKREVVEPARGLAVLVQTIDPAAEFGGGAGRKPQMTVYSLVINVRAGDGSADIFGTAALGYCALVDVASCSREIVAAIDEEIARRKLR